MSDYFRIVRGLELDEKVRILTGTGVPGSTADTDSAFVGSIFLSTSAGALYTKISAGTGSGSWTAAGTGGGSGSQLIGDNADTPTIPVAQGVNSLALGSGATTASAANNSFALGDQSLARLPGSLTFASGRFGSQGDAQTGRYLLRTVSVNGSPTEAFIDGTGGSQRLVLPDDSTWTFKITVTGHRQDASDGHAGYTLEGVIYRGAGAATTSFQGAPIKSVIGESNPSWDINTFADTTNGSLTIKVTGQPSKIIRWLALVETLEVTN